jgi:hypothetical protein
MINSYYFLELILGVAALSWNPITGIWTKDIHKQDWNI